MKCVMDVTQITWVTFTKLELPEFLRKCHESYNKEKMTEISQGDMPKNGSVKLPFVSLSVMNPAWMHVLEGK